MKVLTTLISWFGEVKWTVWSFIFLSIASLLIFGDWIGAGKLEAISGGYGMLDVGPSFSNADAYQLLQNMGEEGRRFYVQILLTIDMIYPLLYAIFGVALLATVYKKLMVTYKILRVVIVFPIIAAVCDYLENTFILIMLKTYPHQEPLAAFWGNMFHMSKLVIGIMSMMMVVVGVIMKFTTNQIENRQKQ